MLLLNLSEFCVSVYLGMIPLIFLVGSGDTLNYFLFPFFGWNMFKELLIVIDYGGVLPETLGSMLLN
jgi:hypothetical protein